MRERYVLHIYIAARVRANIFWRVRWKFFRVHVEDIYLPGVCGGLEAQVDMVNFCQNVQVHWIHSLLWAFSFIMQWMVLFYSLILILHTHPEGNSNKHERNTYKITLNIVNIKHSFSCQKQHYFII